MCRDSFEFALQYCALVADRPWSDHSGPGAFQVELFVTLIMLANVNEIHVAIEMLALSS